MKSWTRWSTGMLLWSATSLGAAGCLEDDPNADDDTGTGTGATDDNGPGNGPGGSLDDTGTATDGPTDGGPGVTTEADEVTIYDIQMGMVPDGTFVSLDNVIVTSPVQVADGGVTVQDPMGGQFSGIYLYLFAEVVTGVPLQPGDVVSIRGTYTEFFDQSQIEITEVNGIEVTGSDAVPEPVLVDAADIAVGGADAEAYEGVLVRVEGVTATEATDQFGQFGVDDGLVITNFFLFEQGGFLDVLPGTAFGFAQGPLLYNFEEYKLAPRTEADYSATLVACAKAAAPATIYEIQQGMVDEDDLVVISDVVVTTPFDFGGDTFWVQDPMGGEFSGISVYMPNPGGFVPSPGDQVTVCGAYAEFFDQTQLQVGSDADITAAGNGPVPAPAVVSAADIGGGASAEPWEGVLVEVQDVDVTAEANMFGEWEVDGALLLDDVFFPMMSWPTPAVGENFSSLVGVLTYSFSNYKLAPRNAGDINP